MLTVIVGENSSGKTLYLRNLYMASTSVVTNLCDCFCTFNTISQDRLQVLEDFSGGVLSYKGGVIFIEDGVYSITDEMQSIVKLLCTDGDILILDEPDLLLEKEADRVDLYNIIAELSSTFKEVYVATHQSTLVHCPYARVCKITDTDKLIEVERSTVYEELL